MEIQNLWSYQTKISHWHLLSLQCPGKSHEMLYTFLWLFVLFPAYYNFCTPIHTGWNIHILCSFFQKLDIYETHVWHHRTCNTAGVCFWTSLCCIGFFILVCFLHHVKFLIFFSLSIIAFFALYISPLFAQLSTCSLVISVVFLSQLALLLFQFLYLCH